MSLIDSEIKQKIIDELNESNEITNSRQFAIKIGKEHEEVVAELNSLHAYEILLPEVIQEDIWEPTQEGQDYIEKGSPEVIFFNSIPQNGIALSELQKTLGPIAQIGFSQCMKLKWITTKKIEPSKEEIEKQQQQKKKAKVDQMIFQKVEKIEDKTKDLLLQLTKSTISSKDLQALKRRKLAQIVKIKYFKITKGATFERLITKKEKVHTDFNKEILSQELWKDAFFKKYNFNALGIYSSGHLHPLLKVRTQVREAFLELGFEEMDTSIWVESSFWNFDTLFQPQQHPARDMHDTFFMSKPEFSSDFPKEYMEKVKETHEKGGYESIGWRYDWDEQEAKKNIMRTHTTAISSRTLNSLIGQEFKPRRFFSIDRVFRNETLDATHLAEFHQVEGFIIDKNLSLGDLIGVITQFFQKLGMNKLKFKPAYNPYTEPSMEIFIYHDGLKRWIEVGNSGIFRPEMLRPMGFDEDVSVIAWGLSLERPTMIKYKVNNIRDLFGHKVDLQTIYSFPLCKITLEKFD
ncbi:phenylalanine--tRNA ligase alpha subunit [Anaeramoeba ignava]|uniref:phenylalanine--tRNA ligase n=1 Tax=Anaeramoeba ignava TaxID=1746090 RepID=A0A9Q0RCG6_ANAIG|nr:phenylalanine--tRNA ligase alpha subunit [Anaeramoeba ignava]